MSEEKKQTAPETEAEEKETAAESEEVKENGPGETAAEPAEEELQAKYLRLAADFQNFKRSTEKEKSDIYAYANEKLVTELLGVLDNFERALAREEDWSDKKMLEGMAKFLFGQLKGMYTQNVVTKMSYLVMKDSLKGLKKSFDASEYGGAPLLGLQKPVIKAHGSSDAKAITNAVYKAEAFIRTGVITEMEALMQKYDRRPARKPVEEKE